jgi:cytochrome c-type biogenesis protein
MLEQIPVVFLAGLVSIVFPCVLPLVPGYLSAVSAVEAGKLGEPGVGRRVAAATLPFVAGFTAVFVALGAGAAALGGAIDDRRLQSEVAGFVLVVMGLGFIGLLPWPDRALSPSLVQGARGRGSNALLGGAFAVCAAPCIGVVLGSVLVLASDSDTVVKGAFLLAVYSIGLGAGFLLAGLAFARAMSAFRWVRDHYRVLQVAGGATLVALGLLLFFDRTWWLYVAVDEVFVRLGLESV